jgi:non-specific protein-tyrosine kinase
VDSSSYFAILWKRKWLILITTIVTLAIVAFGTLQMPPRYTATTLLRLLPYGFDAVDYTQLQYSSRLANSYIEVAQSDIVREQVQQQLGLTELPRYELSIITNTDLMRLEVNANDPVLAREVANAVADVLVDQDQATYQSVGRLAQDILSEELATLEAELETLEAEYRELIAQVPVPTERIAQLSREIDERERVYNRVLDTYTQARVSQTLQSNVITVVQRADVPTQPSGPNLPLNMAIGAGAGLIGGIALAFIFELSDDKLYTAKQAENAANLTVIGKIPRIGRSQRYTLVNDHSVQSEAFRHLRTQVYSMAQNRNVKTLLLTSAEPEVGKSTVVANLAHSIAQSGRDVLVIDADMRRPKLHELLSVSNGYGLAHVLAGEVAVGEAIVKTAIPHLYILPSGRTPSNPAELLSRSTMEEMLGDLREKFSMILIDSPPFLAVTDAAILAPLVDGVVMVLMLSYSTQDAVADTREQLASVNARLAGVVVNRADEDTAYRKYHYEYHPVDGHDVEVLPQVGGRNP